MQLDRVETETLKVLIVDDRPKWSEPLIVQLTSLGYILRFVKNSQQARNEIVSFIPNLVLVSVTLPHQEAYELCQWIKQSELTQEIGVIFLIPSTILAQSEADAIATRQQVFTVGGDDYLLEPWIASEVKRRLAYYQTRSQPWIHNWFQTSNDAIAAFDRHYQFILYNPQFNQEFTDIFGQSPIARVSVLTLLKDLPEEQRKAQYIIDRALQGEAYTTTETFGDRDLHQQTYELSLAPILNPQGQIIGVSLVARNVTQRIEAEAQLQTLKRELEQRVYQRTAELQQAHQKLQISQRLFWTVTNAAPVLLWMSDEGGEFSFFNQPWLHFTGSTYDESLGQGWIHFLHPDDRERVLQAYRSHFEQRQPLEIEYRLRRADGSYEWLLDRSQPHYSSQGVFEGYIGCCIEIGDRKAAEAALQENEKRYRFLFNRGNDLIFVHHFEENGRPGKFIEVNDIACETLGYSRAELLQLSPEDIDVPDTQIRLPNIIKTLFERRFCVFEQTLCTKDQQQIPVENSSHLFLFQGHQTCLTISRDIRDRKLTAERLKASEERFRLITENMTDLVCLHEPDGRYRYLSPSCETLLGYKPEELININPYILFHPEDQELIQSQSHNPNLKGQKTEITYRLRTQSGKYIWLNTVTKPIVNESGQVTRLLTTSRAVGDRVRAEQALRASQMRLNTIVNNTSYGIVIVDRMGKILFVNVAAVQLFNRSQEELIGSDLGIPAIANEPAELEIIAHRGCLITVEIRIKEIEWNNEIVNIISLQDITERKQAEAQLEYRAYYDTLTDLPNRTFFMSRLSQAIQGSQQNPTFNFAVLFLDLDRFKIVNDSLGHLVGDRLLVSFAQRLKTILRPLDTVARLGGDEFTILLEDIRNPLEVTQVARSINQSLQIPFSVDGMSIVTTVSIGIALSNSKYTQPEYLLRDADLAMYRAKEKGRARYEIFDETMHHLAIQQLRIEHDLRLAIEHQEFVAYYQPIINLQTQQLSGFEALIRWQHPQRGLVSPNEFIPIAEETGLIATMGEWMLQQTCQQLRLWQETLPNCEHLRVSVNLSGHQLQEDTLLAAIDRVLAQTGIAGSSLKLELTESMLIDNVEEAIALLDKIRDRGIQLSIDDFGTGYSSLSYLHRFPVNTLKIDKSFVSRMGLGGENREIVETIIALARQLDLDAIAEGVETHQQLQQLQALGCKFAQGYYFARPITATAATKFITEFPVSCLFSQDSPPGA
jgi:diguanylate cyclase (GGDEF)-like protein/PAS domain S-box-containing protein